MNPPLRTFLGMLVLTVAAAALAGWLGVQYGVHRSSARSDLDTLLHTQLDLSGDQDRRIDALEAQYASQRRALQGEMGAANRELAEAITRDHFYGPTAEQAVDRFHRAMRALQEASIRHVLAMRAVLTSQQAKQFDEIVNKDLVSGAP